jgi:hypothetical protein
LADTAAFVVALLHRSLAPDDRLCCFVHQASRDFPQACENREFQIFEIEPIYVEPMRLIGSHPD